MGWWVRCCFWLISGVGCLRFVAWFGFESCHLSRGLLDWFDCKVYVSVGLTWLVYFYVGGGLYVVGSGTSWFL